MQKIIMEIAMNRFWKLTVLMSFLIILDQMTKGYIQQHFAFGESMPVISGFFNIVHAQNTGAAFSMGAGSSEAWRQFLFLFIPVLVCFYIFYLLIKNLKTNFWHSLSYAFILAGAIGNLIDRFILKYVVDFLDFYYSTHHFPAFNVADSCITIGATILIIDSLFESKKKKNVAHTS